jgi:hypothetical protein
VIVVSIMDNGNVEYRCSWCEIKTVIKIHDSESVFWDMHNGLAILAMLGHYKGTHK